MNAQFQRFVSSCAVGKAVLSRSFHYLRDSWLALALLFGLALGLQGFTWGTYDCLNLDRMALKDMVAKQRPPLHPGTFFKPPFYSYMNHFLARIPAQTFASNLFWMPKTERFDFYLKLRLALARFWNLVLFAGCVILVYTLAREFFGLPSARIAALLLATSAGFVPYQIFLTTDLAVVFMMLSAFACAAAISRNPTMGWSIAAGLLTGLAAATKYNGLAVAVALPVAHLIGSRGNPVLACLKRPAAWVCGLAVPAGFLIGNPYALLAFGAFKSDFLYNYKVTPVYGGETRKNGYWEFFQSYFEVFGKPGVCFILAGIAIGLVVVFVSWKKNSAWKLWLLAFLVGGLYAWKIGAFPRMETRFVLPSAPFALLLGAAGFGTMMRARWITAPVVICTVLFNLACGWWVGELFRQDPRNSLLSYVREHVPNGSIVEVSSSIPRIADLPDSNFTIHRIPSGIDRLAKFSERFSTDEEVMEIVSKKKETADLEWFSPEARKNRHPDWIFWSTIDIEKSTRPFHEALLGENSGYRIVWDGASPKLPSWVYPQNTEFLRNRTTVWKKAPPTP